MNTERLEWDFAYHAPDTAKRLHHESIRDACKELALLINEAAPDSREKEAAITKLEDVMFWTNASIARNPRPEGTI